MQRDLTVRTLSFFLPLVLWASSGFATETEAAKKNPAPPGLAQVPTWSQDDLNFFLHGSMSTEVIPEAALRAFTKTYPDLFPTADLSHLGLIPDPGFGWPIGFSRTEVKHLGGLPSVGVNCASCHVAQITATTGGDPVRILGATSHFDAEAFFGSVLVATFKTAETANMKKFLSAYLGADGDAFEAAWRKQEGKVAAALKDDPLGAKGVAPGELHEIAPDSVRPSFEPDLDLAARAHAMLQLFHNLRAALHIPDQPPANPPPASGPGRNDAFGLLSAILLNSPQPYSPVKFGLVWNVDQRTWVHWDGNTESPVARNLLASLGLGAPLHGRQANLQFALVKRQTDLSEKIRPPQYPFAIDQAAAKRGAAFFEAKCVACHGGPESDKRLYPVAEVGTDPRRATLFTQKEADGFNKFLAELEIAGYEPPKKVGLRSTGKYFAASLNGAWARSPYLHNGSVRTLRELLTLPNERAATFHRGSHRYDPAQMGYTDEGAYVLDASKPGNANSGHDYGTDLSTVEKTALIEYLKTL
jgi:hypothetical protein